VDPDSLYDVQVKRIHEYKRQHLNVLHVIALYHRIKSDPHAEIQPRTFIFGGKAAPGYYAAKLVIKLITAVADVVNRDPQVRDRLKVVFMPNFNVTSGQRIYPAADLSEQISTAGKEASGTGNMKFCMNGALTIGTLDGANIEIRHEVGPENFFMFGLSAAEVEALRHDGYRPAAFYESNPELRAVIDLIRDGFFSRGDATQFRPIVDGLLNWDTYMLLADFQSYVDCQAQVSHAYNDFRHWSRMSILNVARSGVFSSDRTVREYANEIWHVPSVPIRLLSQKDLNFGLA
jgi:starch phosphorylase